jgi:hypothetical protein
MNKLASGLAAGLLVAGLSVPASAGATTPAQRAASTQVIYNCQRPHYEPSVIVIACADANTVLRHMRYARWSRHSAAGAGVMYTNSCTPNCAAGTLIKTATRFKLERPKRVDGQRRFSRLIAYYPHAPARQRRQVFELVTRPL